MPRLLLVKTSSLGDVVHAFPAVSDLHRARSGWSLDWVVEEAFVELPALHPGVAQVLAVALRRWRRAPLTAATWREVRAARRRLAQERYDAVVDLQGLLKSALVAAAARGPRHGPDAASAREGLASALYGSRYLVPRGLHAIERNRRLLAAAVGYELSGAPDYGIDPAPEGARLARAVLLHSTSRQAKLWPEASWRELAGRLAGAGLDVLLPGGSDEERARSARLAEGVPAARALPRLRLGELADVLRHARLVVGVDTGLVHLAAALGTPALALFVDSDPSLTGVIGARAPARNLGGSGRAPSVDEAHEAALALLASAERA